MSAVDVLVRVVETAVTVWVCAVVVVAVGLGSMVLGRRVLPERYEPPALLRRPVSVVGTMLLMVALAPLLLLVGVAVGAQALGRRGRRRDPGAARSTPTPGGGRDDADQPRTLAPHLRQMLLTAPVVDPPAPWRSHRARPVGGLRGVGFGVDADHDLLMVVSLQGRGLFDAATGELVDRDDDPDPDLCWPDGPDLTCPGLGPLAGTDVRIAGLLGGDLPRAAAPWAVEVVAPDHQILLTRGPTSWTAGGPWWLVAHTHSELRAAGFSPTGRTLVVATGSEVWWATRDTAG